MVGLPLPFHASDKLRLARPGGQRVSRVLSRSKKQGDLGRGGQRRKWLLVEEGKRGRTSPSLPYPVSKSPATISLQATCA